MNSLSFSIPGAQCWLVDYDCAECAMNLRVWVPLAPGECKRYWLTGKEA